MVKAGLFESRSPKNIVGPRSELNVLKVREMWRGMSKYVYSCFVYYVEVNSCDAVGQIHLYKPTHDFTRVMTACTGSIHVLSSSEIFERFIRGTQVVYSNLSPGSVVDVSVVNAEICWRRESKTISWYSNICLKLIFSNSYHLHVHSPRVQILFSLLAFAFLSPLDFFFFSYSVRCDL